MPLVVLLSERSLRGGFVGKWTEFSPEFSAVECTDFCNKTAWSAQLLAGRICGEGQANMVHEIVDHNTSQMFRTMGLLPVCAGLRGSTVSFSGVHCRGGSHQV